MKKVTFNNPKTRKNKAFDYYLSGLNSKEISKLLNCSFRTIQNYMSKEHWKERRAAKNSGL
jgi:uncharacterized protein YjcR